MEWKRYAKGKVTRRASFVGKTGGGKTTLLKAVCGLDYKDDRFKSSSSLCQGTKPGDKLDYDAEVSTGALNYILQVMDSIGIAAENSARDRELLSSVAEAIMHSLEAVNALVLVLKHDDKLCSTVTEVLKTLLTSLPDYKHLHVVFTAYEMDPHSIEKRLEDTGLSTDEEVRKAKAEKFVGILSGLGFDCTRLEELLHTNFHFYDGRPREQEKPQTIAAIERLLLAIYNTPPVDQEAASKLEVELPNQELVDATAKVDRMRRSLPISNEGRERMAEGDWVTARGTLQGTGQGAFHVQVERNALTGATRSKTLVKLMDKEGNEIYRKLFPNPTGTPKSEIWNPDQAHRDHDFRVEEDVADRVDHIDVESIPCSQSGIDTFSSCAGDVKRATEIINDIGCSGLNGLSKPGEALGLL